VAKGVRVLLVDDDKMISGAGRHILEDKGYLVDTANNGEAALELFQRNIKTYDLIITDLTMPKMTGLELTKAIRKLSKDVYIILTSGNLDPKLQIEFESLGFNGFVRKPWTASEMLKSIDSLFPK
jgi:CheY-like chemotaxis protein